MGIVPGSALQVEGGRTLPDPESLRGMDLEALRREAMRCTACPLARTRTQVVFGEGNDKADLLFLGEAPGRQEDTQGRPFVGAAGQVLDRILAAADIARQEVYITNTVMCRPPGNRVPTPEERAACRPFLDAKIREIRPSIVVLLGATAAQSVLGPDLRISRDRGRILEEDGIRYMPTFHPAALLHDPSKKVPVWQDIQKVRDLYRGPGVPSSSRADSTGMDGQDGGSAREEGLSSEPEPEPDPEMKLAPHAVQRRLTWEA